MVYASATFLGLSTLWQLHDTAHVRTMTPQRQHVCIITVHLDKPPFSYGGPGSEEEIRVLQKVFKRLCKDTPQHARS